MTKTEINNLFRKALEKDWFKKAGIFVPDKQRFKYDEKKRLLANLYSYNGNYARTILQIADKSVLYPFHQRGKISKR